MGLFARIGSWLARLLKGGARQGTDPERELMRFFGGENGPSKPVEGGAR
jgi:hypothetical protein